MGPPPTPCAPGKGGCTALEALPPGTGKSVPGHWKERVPFQPRLFGFRPVGTRLPPREDKVFPVAETRRAERGLERDPFLRVAGNGSPPFQGFGRGAHAPGGDSGAGGGPIRSRKRLARLAGCPVGRFAGLGRGRNPRGISPQVARRVCLAEFHRPFTAGGGRRTARRVTRHSLARHFLDRMSPPPTPCAPGKGGFTALEALAPWNGGPPVPATRRNGSRS